MEQGTRGAPLGGILALVGGALLAIGSFLAWAEISGGGTTATAKGIDGSDGYITLGAGIVALIGGIAMMRRTRRLLGIVVLLAGILGGGVGLYDALTAKDRVLDDIAEQLAPSFGVSSEQTRTLLDAAIDAGQISISISIGLYVVIAGGLLAAVGGVLGMRGSTSAPTQQQAAFAPPPTAPAGSGTSAPPGPPTAPDLPAQPPSTEGGP